jgi:hypothetical protein
MIIRFNKRSFYDSSVREKTNLSDYYCRGNLSRRFIELEPAAPCSKGLGVHAAAAAGGAAAFRVRRVQASPSPFRKARIADCARWLGAVPAWATTIGATRKEAVNGETIVAEQTDGIRCGKVLASLERGHSFLAPFPSISPFFPIPPISVFFATLRATGDWHLSRALDRAGQQAADRRETQGRSQQCQSGRALWR